MAVSLTLETIAGLVQGKPVGDLKAEVNCVASLDKGQKNSISYVVDKKYLKLLSDSNAGILLLPNAFSEHWQGNAVICRDPKLAFAIIAKKLHPLPKPLPGVHETAIIDPSAKIGQNVAIGPHAVIEANANIGDNSVIGAFCHIGRGCQLGQGCFLFPRVTIYYETILGNECCVQTGAVLGSEGFGFAPTATGWEKVPQLGKLIVGNNVEIGANTTIDRGALGDTIIENDVILDNLIQIAHNVVIGQGSAIAANTGIAGSTVVGKRCMIGGGCNINGHITICDGVQLVGASNVGRSIHKPGAYGSAVMISDIRTWKRNATRFQQLEKMAQTLSKLDTRLEELEER